MPPFLKGMARHGGEMGHMQIGSATVMFVDDVDAIVEELITLMELHGIQAVGAADLDQAVQMLEYEPAVQVLCCDLRLAQQFGMEIVSRVGRHPVLCDRNLKYLFVTGDKSLFSGVTKQGQYQVLSKPVHPAVLVRTIQDMLLEINAAASWQHNEAGSGESG